MALSGWNPDESTGVDDPLFTEETFGSVHSSTSKSRPDIHSVRNGKFGSGIALGPILPRVDKK